MEELSIEGTENSPTVTASGSTMELKGVSLIENASAFYDQLKKWLEATFDEGVEKMEMRIQLSYFNSSSAKQLVQLFYILEDTFEEDNSKVIWRYEEEDESIYDRGKELEEMTDIPFTYETI